MRIVRLWQGLACLVTLLTGWVAAQPPIRSHVRVREPAPVARPAEPARTGVIRVSETANPRMAAARAHLRREFLAQVLLNGEGLSEVTILIRPGDRSVRTNQQGIVTLTANPGDTLIFVRTGLVTREARLFNMTWNCFTFEMATGVLTPVPLLTGNNILRSLQVPNFPWPPPHASASEVLDGRLFRRARTLAGVDSILVNALKRSGYFERSYYRVPQGFALVTRIEQIDEQAAPRPDPARWSLEVKPFEEFTITNYLKSLFQASVGRFRIIAFIVTNQPVTEDTSDETSFNEAVAWLKLGAKSLPESIGQLAFRSDYRCTALIYEFRKPESAEAMLVNPSINQGAVHLQKAKILQSLNR